MRPPLAALMTAAMLGIFLLIAFGLNQLSNDPFAETVAYVFGGALVVTEYQSWRKG